MTKVFLVVFERTAEDNWGAWVPDIPGAVGAGDSKEDARISVLAGIESQLEYAAEMNQPMPQPASKTIDVSDFDTSPETGHYELSGSAWTLPALPPLLSPKNKPPKDTPCQT